MSKLQKIVKDRGAWHAAVHGIAHSEWFLSKKKSHQKEVASIGKGVKTLTSLCIIGGKVPGASSMENSRKVTHPSKSMFEL